jgi:hypothetical protein
MILRFYDEDTAFDEIIGSLEFELAELFEHPDLEKGFYKWYNITGAPEGKDNSHGVLMNH